MNSASENIRISKSDLVRVFLRSLFLQATWNFERMQSLGFAFALDPVLRKLYRNNDEYNRRLRLHTEYFNTQPYFASFILGATVRCEEDRAAGESASADITSLKKTLTAPLGALGDSFFWGALKPLSSVTAVALVLIGIWWAPLLFLFFYNGWHIVLRLQLVFRGYDSSGDAVSLMERYRFTQRAQQFKAVSLSVLGGIIGMVLLWRPEIRIDVVSLPYLMLASLFCITILLVAVIRRGLSPVQLMLGLAVICVGLAYSGAVP
jgi:mannose PTS system EIID component